MNPRLKGRPNAGRRITSPFRRCITARRHQPAIPNCSLTIRLSLLLRVESTRSELVLTLSQARAVPDGVLPFRGLTSLEDAYLLSVFPV